jgi:predicted ATPase/DNA-binding SARP family transcriptional activator
VEFRLLGRLEVEADGIDLTPARPKRRALLALLLLHAGEVVATDDLVEALWGERPPETAHTALHGHISALRKRLGAERIETRPPGYLLRLADGDELDVRRFEHIAAETPAEGRLARSEQLREALALVRGEPLADFRYEAFASQEIARLEELRLAVVEERIQAELALGRYEEVVPELERLIAENPLREGLRAQLMLALYRAGRQADALKAFQDARTMLLDELGIDPTPALQRLERQILNQDPELAAPDAFAPARHPPATKPVGIVTFLVADSDGSRGLELVRTVVGQHGGFEVETAGGSCLAAFVRARDAVATAVGIQRATGVAGFRVGINSADSISTDEGYGGPGVRGAASIWSAAHPGQVLLSQATRDLLRETPLEEAYVRALGEYRLHDLAAAQRVFQLVAPGLEDEFPPLRSLESRPTNLPLQPTLLVGREREIREVTDLLRRPDVGLVTLSGTGGTGKTRLALHVAAELLDDFADGVFFVDLAPLADPELVLSTAARTLGVLTRGGGTLVDAVGRYLRDRRLLLVLDNFEHVLEAGPAVAGVAASAPGAKLLVTSRAHLHLDAEHVYPVSPLETPGDTDDVERLLQRESVALFESRARAVRPDFAIRGSNAQPVAGICQALDGLPLAIELAATRVGVLPPAALLKRLDDRLKLLKGGARDAPERQRTLRATIDWSYDLLEEPEQRTFVRLAVFAGGCTLEATESVCGDDLDVVDALASLTETCLVRVEGTEPRFSMLETIRAYARERLGERGEAADASQRHAEYFLRLAEMHAVPFSLLDFPKDDLAWFDREHDNLRTALDWFGGQSRPEAPELELRLGNACASFWYQRGYWSEGRGRLASASARSGTARTAARADALVATAFLASRQGDPSEGKALVEEALGLLRELGGHERQIRRALVILSHCEHDLGDRARAVRIVESLIPQTRADGDERAAETMLNVLGNFALEELDFARARKHLSESSEIARRLGIHTRLANALVDLGFAALGERDVDSAAPALQESLGLARAERALESIVWGVEGTAAVAVERNSEAEAVVLLAAMDAQRAALGVGENYYPIANQVRDRTLAAAREVLGDAAYDTAWAEGAALSLEAAAERAATL